MSVASVNLSGPDDSIKPQRTRLGYNPPNPARSGQLKVPPDKGVDPLAGAKADIARLLRIPQLVAAKNERILLGIRDHMTAIRKRPLDSQWCRDLLAADSIARALGLGDGYVARKVQEHIDFGKIIDLCDKHRQSAEFNDAVERYGRCKADIARDNEARAIERAAKLAARQAKKAG